jgi:hypothetical protein
MIIKAIDFPFRIYQIAMKGLYRNRHEALAAPLLLHLSGPENSNTVWRVSGWRQTSDRIFFYAAIQCKP